jgi:hypothetical protein
MKKHLEQQPHFRIFLAFSLPESVKGPVRIPHFGILSWVAGIGLAVEPEDVEPGVRSSAASFSLYAQTLLAEDCG